MSARHTSHRQCPARLSLTMESESFAPDWSFSSSQHHLHRFFILFPSWFLSRSTAASSPFSNTSITVSRFSTFPKWRYQGLVDSVDNAQSTRSLNWLLTGISQNKRNKTSVAEQFLTWRKSLFFRHLSIFKRRNSAIPPRKGHPCFYRHFLKMCGKLQSGVAV